MKKIKVSKDWTIHDGDENPVPSKQVKIIYNDGTKEGYSFSSDWYWGHDIEDVVIAYRVKREKKPETACEICGIIYGSPSFPDMVIPHEIFAKIALRPPEGGLFCPNCMCARLQDIGETGVEFKFTTGPFALKEAEK